MLFKALENKTKGGLKLVHWIEQQRSFNMQRGQQYKTGEMISLKKFVQFTTIINISEIIVLNLQSIIPS